MSNISCVVLSYNKAWIISKMIRSLQRQTMRPEQVIIVDDGSTDGTQRIISSFPDKYVKILNRRNRGQSHARNLGASKANKEFIIFLDGDIEMHPRMLAIMREALMRDKKTSFAYCHYNRTGSRKDPMKSKPWNPAKLRTENYISTMSLIRRAHLRMPVFDVGLKMYEDWDLWRWFASAGKKGVLVNHILFTANYDRKDVSGSGESRGWYRRAKAKRYSI